MAIERGRSASANSQRPKPHEAMAVPNQAPPPVSKKTPSKRRKQHAEPWTYTRRGYALAQSFRQLRSRKIASFTTLLVFGVTLALPALILFTASSLAALGNKSVGEESVTAYLTMQTPDLDGAALAVELQAQAGIKQVSYISRAEALAIFNEQSDIGEAINVLGQNPLPGSIIVYPDTDAMSEPAIKQLASRIQALDEVDLSAIRPALGTEAASGAEPGAYHWLGSGRIPYPYRAVGDWQYHSIGIITSPD